jgi:hypothetical protein
MAEQENWIQYDKVKHTGLTVSAAHALHRRHTQLLVASSQYSVLVYSSIAPTKKKVHDS